MRKSLAKYWPLFILLLLTVLAAWKNIVPGTFLTGWDNLHPEFDFRTNIVDRGIKGAWQYYQGLGVPSGNAHSADLPRQIALWIASLIIPQNYLRYSYHLFAWFAGGAGIYILISQLLLTSRVRIYRQIAGFAGALFYMFNLGTMQNFYAPYEAFSHFYMMLPWLIYGLCRYIHEGTRKHLWRLFIINILALPMAYIPTVFIVYIVCLAVLCAGFLLRSRLALFRRVAAAAVVIVAVNAYWLMPFIHFVSQNTQGVVDAKINRMFTREAFLRNQEYGTPEHALLLEGFWFDTTDMTSAEGTHDLMMRPWTDFLAKPLVKPLLWILCGIAMLGLVSAIVRRKPLAITMTVVTFAGFFALINDNWPTGSVFRFMQENVPLFGQILRFPYTKFIVVAVFGYAAGIAWFIDFLLSKTRSVGIGVAALICSMIIYTQLPTLSGNFFYDKLRLTIPDEYFSLFQFFQQEDRYRGRIANLPQPTFWGWTSYSWEYRGSGFPWYGIPQPILDRNFDVWSPESEQYYADMTHALYDQETSDQFLAVLDTYGVDYIWIDSSVINPQKPALLDMSLAEAWLGRGGYSLAFQEGKQKVYKRNLAVDQFGPALSHKPHRESEARLVDLRKYSGLTGDYWRYKDLVFDRTTMPAYIADRQDDSQIYTYGEKDIEKAEASLTETNRVYRLSDLLPEISPDERTWWMRSLTVYYSGNAGSSLKMCLAKVGSDECYYIGTDVNEKGGSRWGTFLVNTTTSLKEVTIRLDGDTIRPEKIQVGYMDTPSGQFPLSAVPPSLSTSLEVDLSSRNFPPTNCFTLGNGWVERIPSTEGGEPYVRYRSYDASSCESMLIGNSDVLVQGGTISIRSRNIEGRPVKICLRHDPPGNCLVEELLTSDTRGEWTVHAFEIPPVTKTGDLYIEIDNYAVGQETRANDVGRISLVSGGKQDVQTDTEQGGQIIHTNNQAYRSGWVAIGLTGDRGGYELEHTKVNGWANGWIIPEDVERAVVLYWPQLLQYAGFVILGAAFLIFKLRRK